jgi:hypothetical protein
MAQVVRQWPSKHEALSSTPATEKKKKKINKKKFSNVQSYTVTKH